MNNPLDNGIFDDYDQGFEDGLALAFRYLKVAALIIFILILIIAFHL